MDIIEAWHKYNFHYISISVWTFIRISSLPISLLSFGPGPALVSLETDQGALEQATVRVLGLRMEGHYTKGYCRMRIQN